MTIQFRPHFWSALLLAQLYLCASSASAQIVGSCETPLATSVLDVADVRARIYANGNLFWRSGDPFDAVGYEVAEGPNRSLIFTSGIWIGGIVNGRLRLAGAEYRDYHFWTGPLNDQGQPPFDCSRFDRIWKVGQSDIDAYEFQGQLSDDLADWPTGLGAPTLSPRNTDGSETESDGIDNDADGTVDEGGEMRSITDEVLALPLDERIDRKINLGSGERPEILGDEMLWWIMNDVGNDKVFMYDEDGVTSTVTSPPIGIEVHASAFAFALPGSIGKASFYRLRIFNKGLAALTDAFLGLYSDSEIGARYDDAFASDSVNGLGIAYNWSNDDPSEGGWGEKPPAIAYDFLQGPLVEDGAESAHVFRGEVRGFRPLQMTSFVRFTAGYSGDPSTHPRWPEEYYNYMQGRWKDGTPIYVGCRGLRDQGLGTTRFMFPADPSIEYFWTDLTDGGCGATPDTPIGGQFVMGAGPFRFDRDRVQDIFYSIAYARGSDKLESYTKVKQAAREIQTFFDTGLDKQSRLAVPFITEGELEWSNIYPTPGRGQTTLRYKLPRKLPVRIEVFDVLGRQRQQLVRGEKGGGTHTLNFNTVSWPTGIYFVRLSIDGRALGHQRFVVE